ncbi:Ig-like domain-containing protein, partial [Bacillus thuringiensis]
IVKSGSTTLGTAKAESNGKYSVGIKPQKVGTTLSVTASNTAGLSEAATVVVTEEKPGKPIVNAVKDTDTTVTGTTKAGADVTVKSGSTTLGTAKAESNGKYSVGIQPQKVGTTLSVTASNTAGLSEAATVVVTEEELTLNVNPLMVGDNTVYGTNSPNVTRVYIYLNDQLIRYRNVEPDGRFYGHVSNTLQAGDVVSIIPVDVNGKKGKVVEVTVQERQVVEAPTLNKYISGDMYLTGTVAPGTSYVRIYVNGVHLRKRNVESNGVDLMAYIRDADAKPGDVVKVVPYDDKDVAGKEASLVVQALPIEVNKYLEGDEQLFGKATQDADKVDIYINGYFLRTRGIDKITGEFYASMRSSEKGLPKTNDLIRLVARTDKGVTLSETEVIVGKGTTDGAPVINDFQESDLTISGTVLQGAQKIRIYYGPDMKQVLNRGTIDQSNQTFKVYVGDLALKTGDTLKIVTLNDIGRESAPAIVIVK